MEQNHKDLPDVPKSYDWQEFRKNAHQTIDLIVDYHEALESKEIPCQAEVEPGYLLDALALEADESAQDWQQINDEIKEKVIPGMTHWQLSLIHI